MTDIQWVCPQCGAENVDSYGDTALPVCGNCEQEYFWNELAAHCRVSLVRDFTAIETAITVEDEDWIAFGTGHQGTLIHDGDDWLFCPDGYSADFGFYITPDDWQELEQVL